MSGLREERTLGAVMVGTIRLLWAAEVRSACIAGLARDEARSVVQLPCKLGGRHTPVPPMPQ